MWIGFWHKLETHFILENSNNNQWKENISSANLYQVFLKKLCFSSSFSLITAGIKTAFSVFQFEGSFLKTRNPIFIVHFWKLENNFLVDYTLTNERTTHHEIGQPKADFKSLKTRSTKWTYQKQRFVLRNQEDFFKNQLESLVPSANIGFHTKTNFAIHTFRAYLNFPWRYCFSVSILDTKWNRKI